MIHKNWIGWNPYERYVRNLSYKNPAAAATVCHQPQNFHVAKATVYGTNNPEHASSTFIQNFRYYPTSNRVFVTIGGNHYWYSMSPKMLSTWLCSDSLGGFYNSYVKLR